MHEFYAFGSLIRGDVTPNSDADILVIPFHAGEKKRYPEKWSVYTRETLLEYFRKGRLFAWHLHLESRCLYTPLNEPWLVTIGTPASYQSARSDIVELKKLLDEALDQIQDKTNSMIYELGLVYTAIRDIAMSASWAVSGRPNFSRNAPYELPILCPLAPEIYRIAMMARHASTRGTHIPSEVELAVESIDGHSLHVWIKKLQEKL